MNWHKLNSTILNAAAYDSGKHILRLKMIKNDSQRNYFKVPEDIYNSLINAESPGKYYLKKIRGKYKKEEIKKSKLSLFFSNLFSKQK